MKSIEQLQEKIDKSITKSIWDTIGLYGIEGKIYDVQMQGSYAKGTDLPKSGSDFDIFIIFNTDISQREMELYGVDIGMDVLEGKNPKVKDATSKYVEAYFEVEGNKFEVQIIPIRHLTLEQIQTKTLNGKPITIGMERTPHQTKFMIEALNGKTEQVRELKQFMKNYGIYDSSMKSQGFSGYATECLIHYLGDFDGVMSFFANLKKGQVLGEGKRNTDNIFSIIDPVDADRDLISAFSDEKIARTIMIAKRWISYGYVSCVNPPTPIDSTIIQFETTENDEDKIFGQVRKITKSIVTQITKMGFAIPTTSYEINNFNVDIPRTSIEIDGNKITIKIGTNDFEIPYEYEDGGVPIKMEKAINNYMKANDGCKFISKDEKIKAIKTRQFTNMSSAIKYVIDEGDVKKTTITDDMRKGTIERRTTNFENVI